MARLCYLPADPWMTAHVGRCLVTSRFDFVIDSWLHNGECECLYTERVGVRSSVDSTFTVQCRAHGWCDARHRFIGCVRRRTCTFCDDYPPFFP